MKQLVFLAGLAALCGVALIGVSAAAGGTVTCTGVMNGGTVNGNLNAGPGCDLEGTHVTGNVTVSSNGSLTANNATIDGNVAIQNDSGTNSICGTAIGGNLGIHNNTGSITVDGSCGDNSVGGNVQIHNNAGQVTLSHTHVGKNLDCHNDSPAASRGTGGDTVGGNSSGECTSTATTPCPSTGCMLTTSDGNTDVTVDVPGGGNSGNLTVILGSPPQDDGCGPYGEGGAPPNPSGDIVTILPPGGYTGSNPIIVEVTFNFSNGLFEICKSNSNKPPYTALEPCNFDESESPVNVPCAEIFEGNSANVYITSNDPTIGGHY